MIIPFDFYYSDLENDKNLDKVYHKGQNRIWDGKEVLNLLFAKYENHQVDPEKEQALKNILNVILWGEYVAWNVSSEMSAQFESYGAKMAAVSQAHDEARHFYVMRDYLRRRFNYTPSVIFAPALSVLEKVASTKNLAKKILGMQLMIEPVAITIFRFLRMSKVDPLLSDLLEYYEKDEARHISLGVKHLPSLIKEMNFIQLGFFIFWQLRMIDYEIRGLKYMEKDFKTLGIDPLKVFDFAEQKQIKCLMVLSEEIGINKSLWYPVIKLVKFRKKLAFYPDDSHGILKRIINSF
jgi:hypothetical protein